MEWLVYDECHSVPPSPLHAGDMPADHDVHVLIVRSRERDVERVPAGRPSRVTAAVCRPSEYLKGANSASRALIR